MATPEPARSSIGSWACPDAEVVSTLGSTVAQFTQRHPDLEGTLMRNYEAVAGLTAGADDLTTERQLLIGAYFTHEYAIEAAALSNPSIVTAPDQSGLGAGERRFILSLRAIGEGHLSSIEFRSGVIDASGRIAVDEPSRFTSIGERREPLYQRHAFRVKLHELGVLNEMAGLVLDPSAGRVHAGAARGRHRGPARWWHRPGRGL